MKKTIKAMAFWLPFLMTSNVHATDGGSVPKPPCSLTVSAGQNKVICDGSNTRLMATPSGGTAPFTYYWNGTALSNPTKQAPVASPSNGGNSVSNNTYTVTVTDAAGCVSTSSVIISVVPGSELITNGDFENVPTPPDGRGKIENAPIWKKATGDGDLFWTGYSGCEINLPPVPPIGLCNTSPLDYNCVGIPCNHFGHQDVRINGTSYYAGLWAGIGPVKVTNGSPALDTTLDLAVEAIRTQIQPLVPGQTYRVNFKISRAEKGEADNLGVTPFASYKIKLSKGPVSADLFHPVAATEIKKGTVMDVQHWETVDFQFTATSDFDHIYIESFLDTLLYLNNTGSSPSVDQIRLTGLEQYFYIDEFSLKFECVADTFIVADAGPDFNVCYGSTITIGGNPVAAGGTPPFNYYWQGPGGYNANVSNPTILPQASGTYTVTVTDSKGFTATDDMMVNVSNMTFDAGDAVYPRCPNDVTTLGGVPTGGIPPYTYNWTPATNISATNTAFVNVSPKVNTIYFVTVTDAAGCQRNDQMRFEIWSVPTVNAGSDVTICEGTSTTLRGSATPYNPKYLYKWNGQLSDTAITVSPSVTTDYTFEVENERACLTTDVVRVTVLPRPRVVAPDKEICIDDSTQIGNVATSGQAPYTYFWSHGLPNQSQHWVKPTSSTTYTVSVKDNRNCYSETTPITVKVNPKPTANAGRDRIICNLGTVGTQIGAIHVASGDEGWGYSWSPTTGLSNPSIARPVAKPAVTTTYTVTVTNAFGCKKTDAMLLTVNVCTGNGETGTGGTGPCLNQPPPNADSGGDLFVCSGTTVTLGGNPSAYGGVKPYTYSWTSTGYSANSPNPTISFVQDRKLVRLVVTDSCGRSSDDYATISMLSPTLPQTPDQSACKGTEVAIGQKAFGGNRGTYTYTWTATPPPAPAGDPIQKVTPQQTTTYTLSVKDSKFCEARDTFVVNVLMPPYVNAGPDKNLCSADPGVQIGGVATGFGTGIKSYKWLPVRGLDYTNIPVVTARPFVTTTYVEMVVDSNNCSNSDTVTVNVSESPYISAGPNFELCEGESRYVGTTVSKGTAPFTYNWSPTTGLSNPTGNYSSVSPMTTTTYTVRVTDAIGCSKDTTFTVTVHPTPIANAGPDLAICEGNSATIGVAATVSGPANITYSWNPYYYLSDASACPTTATPPMDMTYTVTARTEYNCASSDVMTIQVYKSPEFVPNNSFEFDYSGADYATQRGDIEKSAPWFASTGDPDLFDYNYTGCGPVILTLGACGLSPLDYNCIGVPCNHFGYQDANTDYRYAGLFSAFSMRITDDNKTTPTGRMHLVDQKFLTEGMEVRLKKPLIRNREYTFSMWVSKAEKGETGENLPPVLGSGEDQVLVAGAAPFSVKFSVDKVLGETFEPVDRPIRAFGAVVDQTNWEKKTFNFIADSAYEYVIIESDPGVIRYLDVRSEDTHIRVVNNYGAIDIPEDPTNIAFYPNLPDSSAPLEGVYGLQSYMYVDDVSIREVCNTVPPLVVDAGRDTTICSGNSVVLGGNPSASYGTPGYIYKWTNLNTMAIIGSTPNVTVIPTDPTTTYQLEVTDNASKVEVDEIIVNLVVQSDYVLNGTFEGGTLPIIRGQIDSAPKWFKATGDADLYDSDFDCAPIPNNLSPANYNCVDVPTNHFGYAPERTAGKRYGGLWSLVQLSEATTVGVRPGTPPIKPPVTSVGGATDIPVTDPNRLLENAVGGGPTTDPGTPPIDNNSTYTTQVAVEGIEIKLEKPLETDRFYKLSFYVQKAEYGETGDNVSQLPSIGNDIDTKHLLVDECAGFHVKLSTDSVTNILYRPVDRAIIGSGEVCDTSRWEYHYMIFQPVENFNYLVIESYPTDGATQYLAARSAGGNTQQNSTSELSGFQSYFYIDDVELTESCTNTGGGGQELKSKPQSDYMQNLVEKATVIQNTAIEKINTGKMDMSLQVIPNPNNGSFSLNYALGANGNKGAQIVITDAVGKVIQVFDPSFNDMDKHMMDVNLKQLMGEVTAGVYMVRLINGGETLVKKVTVMP